MCSRTSRSSPTRKRRSPAPTSRRSSSTAATPPRPPASTSCVKIKRDDKVLQEVAIGSGPLDASFKAINRMLHMDVKLDSFSLNAVTDGEDAIGEAVVKISDESGKTFTGTGLSTDIIESSIRAYVNGINKMIDAAS